MSRILLGACIFAFASGSALSADLPVYEPVIESPAPVLNDWSGFYLGAHVGYGWGEVEAQDGIGQNEAVFIIEDFLIDVDGPFAGGQAGFRHQFNSLVLGVEASASWADFEGSEDIYFDEGGGIGYDGTVAAQIDWFGLLEGQIGFAADRFLVYAHGGLAFGEIDIDLTIEETTLVFGGGEDTRLGYGVGVGASALVSEHAAVDIKYTFLDLGDEEFDFEGRRGSVYAGSAEVDFQAHLIQLGLNWQF